MIVIIIIIRTIAGPEPPGGGAVDLLQPQGDLLFYHIIYIK